MIRFFILFLFLFSTSTAFALVCPLNGDVSSVEGSVTLNASGVSVIFDYSTETVICGGSSPTTGWSGALLYISRTVGDYGAPPCLYYQYEIFQTAYYYKAVTSLDQCPVSVTNTDGVLNGDETGIDCGGSTGVECVTYCANGADIQIDINGEIFCAFETTPDQLGNCPVNYVRGDYSGGTPSCVACNVSLPLCFSDPFDAAPSLANLQDDQTSPPPSWTYNDVSSSSETTNSTTINPDSTSTTVSNTSTLNPDSSVTTTTTTTTRDANNNVLTETTESTTTGGEPGGTASDYNLAGTIPVDNEYISSYAPDELPEKSSLTFLFDSFIDGFPLFAVLDTFQVSVVAPSCKIEVGEVFEKSIFFDFCRWETYLHSLGSILLLICHAYSVLLVVRR
ncbi:MAG: hypothetical protein IBX47_09565 [Desulfuromonadales bacterium]|nr:hypothetical protein [Desulfuromonadales bacterium]